MDNNDFARFVSEVRQHRIPEAKSVLDGLIARDGLNETTVVLYGLLAYVAGDKGAAERIFADNQVAVSEKSFNSLIGPLFADRPPGDWAGFYELFARHSVLGRDLVGSSIAEPINEGFDAVNYDPWYFSKEFTKFHPRAKELDDLGTFVEKFVVDGWAPGTPPFRTGSKILALGSCFARELRNYLLREGRLADWLEVPVGLNNTFALRSFIHWCVTGEHDDIAYWYDSSESGGAAMWSPPEEHSHFLQAIEAMDGLVVTIGLAEVWYDVKTNGVFWRGVPRSIYDPTKHKVRMTQPAENRSNIEAIISDVRTIRPNIAIIITLSPIPLQASFGEVSCITSDCVSKSVLRVAIDEVMRMAPDSVYYWPSFEIVRWVSGYIDGAVFKNDPDGDDLRHLRLEYISTILGTFLKYYYAE